MADLSRAVGLLLFGTGCAISLLNFYLSFCRYPIHRLRYGSSQESAYSSGAPMIGSLLIVASLCWLSLATAETAWLIVVGSVCGLLDTGGLHWFMLSQLIERHKERTPRE